MNSPGFHQVFKFHQVFTKKKLGEFTRFSPGFQISPSFHQKKNLVNSPGFHQVFTRFSNFTKFSPKKENLVNSPGFHQVVTLVIFSSNSPPKRINFTKKMLKTLLLVNFRGAKRFLIFDFVIFQKPGEFTRFSPSFGVSPSFPPKKTW